MKSKKCDHDCFNCIFDDCVSNELTKEERKEIKERDARYFSLTQPVRIQRHRTRRNGMRGKAFSC